MPIQILDDPVEDRRWLDLVDRHPLASVYHTAGWLIALKQTYGYQPMVISTSAVPELRDGVLICRVKEWVGHRLVSLPFSDHCAILQTRPESLPELLNSVREIADRIGVRSIQVRPAECEEQFEEVAKQAGLRPSQKYWLHRLDLSPDLSVILRRMHRSHTQRAIRRAEREKVIVQSGRPADLLPPFYRLLRLTRRRHGLPPQPIAWFRNLISHLGDRLAIHVASQSGRPIAAMMTFSFRNTIVYKYGASDAARHRLGAMPFLFWHTIVDAKRRGFTELDLGRTDVDQLGLISFKDRMGAIKSPLTYYRYPNLGREAARPSWLVSAARGVISRLPDSALDLAGRLLYRHLG